MSSESLPESGDRRAATPQEILAEARSIARGDIRALPTLEHLQAVVAYSELMERTISMALLGAKKDMTDLERWAEAQSCQKVSASL